MGASPGSRLAYRTQDNHDRYDLSQGVSYSVEPVAINGGLHQIERIKGGMTRMLHAITAAKGLPIGFLMSAGQESDYTDGEAQLSNLLRSGWLLTDRGYEVDWFREALKDKGIKECNPSRMSRKVTVRYDNWRFMRRNRIEFMFGRLKG